MEGFLARLGRLLSAVYIQLSSVSLLCVRQEGEEAELPDCLGHLRNHWILTAAIQFYRSISFGGRFHKLALVVYELSEVPTQLYALNEKADQNDLANYVIMIAIALISINMILTPVLLYVDASVAQLLMVDVALDSCVFLLNTAVIGASPEKILTDVSIWLPAVSMSGIILTAFQPRELDRTDIEWADNPSNDISWDVLGNVAKEEQEEQNDAEEAKRKSIQGMENASREEPVGTSIAMKLQARGATPWAQLWKSLFAKYWAGGRGGV